MASKLTHPERRRRYLQASMHAGYTGLPAEHREHYQAQMRSHERAYPEVRAHALAATNQDFDEPLTAGEREHQAHLRRQENMSQADVQETRRELRGNGNPRPPARAPRARRRGEGAGAGPRAAAAAVPSSASSVIREGKNTGLYVIGIGLLLSLFYLLVAGKGAKAVSGIVNTLAGAASTFIKPVDPISRLESALGAGTTEPGTTRNKAGGLQDTGPAIAHGSPVTGNKGAFVDELAKLTGLDSSVVAAWANHEQGATTVEGGNNWLNVETGGPGGGSGPYGGTAKYVESLTAKQAAAYTAEWLAKNQPEIVAARSKSAAAQVQAIENSPYAESHYGHESPTEFLGAG